MKGLVNRQLKDNFLQFPTAPTKHDLGTTFGFLSKFTTSTLSFNMGVPPSRVNFNYLENSQ